MAMYSSFNTIYWEYTGPYIMWLSSFLVLGYAWALYKEGYINRKNFHQEIPPLGCIFLQGIIGGIFVFLDNNLGCYITIFVFSLLYVALRVLK